MHSMITRRSSPWVCLLLVCCLGLSSCATMYDGQLDQIGGTIAGAAVGAILGGLIGGDAESVLIGAAAGGLMGWSTATVAHYEACQVRTSQEDRRMYGFTKSVSTPTIKIRQGTVEPNRVKAGQEVTVVTDYSIYLPNRSPNVPVQESYKLLRDGKEICTLPPQNKTLGNGGFTGKAAIPVPRGAKPGTYIIEHRTVTGSSYDVTTTSFIVSN
jgi:hypothetical protein